MINIQFTYVLHDELNVSKAIDYLKLKVNLQYNKPNDVCLSILLEGFNLSNSEW